MKTENTQDQGRRDMNTDNTQDAAEPSPASAGSQPVAWAVVYPNGTDGLIAFREEDAADMAAVGDEVVPLYRKPTLTDSERTCLAYAIRKMDAEYAAGPAGVLRELLERLG